jgi:transcriptional regulator with XRE-family HTH domain
MSNMNLKLARVKQRKSQYVLSFETGIPQSTLSLIEQGIKVPKPEEMKKLSKALDSTVHELFPNFEASQCA